MILVSFAQENIINYQLFKIKYQKLYYFCHEIKYTKFSTGLH